MNEIIALLGISMKIQKKQVTVLVRSADTKGLLINFDKHLLMCLKEAEYMMKNGFDVPESARILLFSKQRMKGIS